MNEQDSSGAQPTAPAARPPVQAKASSKPKWLSAITVMAIVFGSLFGCCGVASVGGAMANKVMGPAMMQLPGAADGQEPDLVAAHRRIMERNMALQARAFPFVVASGVLTLLHSLALVLAGIMAHNGRASGRRLLVIVCTVGIGVELIAGGFGLYHASEQGKLSEDMMKAAMVVPTAGEPTPEQREAQKTLQTFAAGMGRASSILGWVMVIVFFATKVAYYVFSSIYLRRPEVVQHFDGGAAPVAAAA